MDDEETIRQIRENIVSDRTDLARPQILDLAERSAKRPMMLLTCASLFLTLGDEDGFQDILKRIDDNLPDRTTVLCDIASGLIALDVPKNALHALEGAQDCDPVFVLRASALHALMRDEEALEVLENIGDSDVPDQVMEAQILASLKRYDEALALLKPLVDRKDYGACRAYVHTLVKADRNKEALKYVKPRAKEVSADGLALMSQLQWLVGNTNAAGAYASRALKVDEGHTGAMEYLGYSLAMKGKTRDAKIVAGSINEKDPGNAAAFCILTLCRD